MMATFQQKAQQLKSCLSQFDDTGLDLKRQLLHHLSAMKLSQKEDLVLYAEALLFILGYPADSDQWEKVDKELNRITWHLKRSVTGTGKALENSGLPFTPIVTRFSHDGVRWLLSYPHCTISLEAIEAPAQQVNDILRLTLTSLEKSETTAGLDHQDLLKVLQVPQSQCLPFLVHELSRLDLTPYIKDYLFDRLDVYVRVQPKDKVFSKFYNRLPGIQPFFHADLQKKISVKNILDMPLPPSTTCSASEKKDIIQVIQNAMILTARETDPTTFLDENSLRLYSLDRGVSIAIYSMIPARQLPLESYVGFTAFKNGLPASYGGAWVFGDRANFGLNIFETFRSGESSFMLASLLRVFRHVFHLQYIEIEPYQFGFDNPEGIESGAFWFFYRMGFRPLDKVLRQFAGKEEQKIAANTSYRSTRKTLTAFTGSSLGLRLGKRISPDTGSITKKVTQMIQRTYGGNRSVAEETSSALFLSQTGKNISSDSYERQVLTEVALWASALNITDTFRLQCMADMIRTKPVNVYDYQDLIIRFYSGREAYPK